MNAHKILGFVYKIYKEIGSTIATITGLYFLFGVYSYFTGLIKPPWLLYTVLITSFLLLSIYVLFLIWSNYIANLKYPFYIKEAKYTHEKVDDMTWKGKKKFVFMPLNSEQFRYVDRYHWTGSGKAEFKTSTPNVTVNEVGVIGHRKYVDYNFNRFLGRGEEVTLDILYKASDEKKQAQNYIDITPVYPTNTLTLCAVLPKKICPLYARWKVAKNRFPQEGKPKQGKVAFDIDIECGSATVTFPKPKRGYHYRLEWDDNSKNNLTGQDA